MKISNTAVFRYLVLLSIVLLPNLVKAQLNGIYTIGPAERFTTIASVIDSLNFQGVSGSVVINVPAGWTETAPAGGYRLGSSTLNATLNATNTLTFQKFGAGANPLLTAPVGTVAGSGVTVAAAGYSGIGEGIFSLSGTDYVTIDGIDLIDPTTNSTATMQMEWGYGFFKLNSAAPFDGCQYNTIKNCTITLLGGVQSAGIVLENNRINSNTSITPTSFGDCNSNNAIYSNLIQKVGTGIFIKGYFNASNLSFWDTFNDVGGNSTSTGNTILSFGAGTNANIGHGIYCLNQLNLNASNNNLDNYNLGRSINGSSTLAPSSGSCYLIYNANSTNTAGLLENASIKNNSLTLTSAAGTTAMAGIYQYYKGGNIDVSNNAITFASTGTSTGAWYGVYSYYASVGATGNFKNNTLSGTFAASTGSVYGLYFYSNSQKNVDISGNTVSNLTRNAVTTGTLYGIYGNYSLNYSTTGYTTNIYNNTVSNISYASTATTGTIYGAYFGGNYNLNIYNNSVRNITNNGTTATGSLYGMQCYYYGTNVSIYGNNISGLTTTSTGTIYGLYDYFYYGTYVEYFNNSISNISSSGSTATIYAWYKNYNLGISPYHNNVIKNIQNTSSTAGNANVYGVYCGNAGSANSSTNIWYNNIISVGNNSSGANVLSNSTGSFYAFYIPSSVASTVQMYFNTISVFGTSSQAAFSAYDVYNASNTAPTKMDLRNNLVMNYAENTNANPTGKIACLRMGGAVSTYLNSTYDVNSNFNNYYLAHSNSTSNSYYYLYDGSVGYNTILGLKNAVRDREIYSFEENTRFLSLDPSDANFFKPDPNIPTRIESGAQAIGSTLIQNGISTDFANTIRQGNTGYLGTSPALPDIGAYEGDFIALDLSEPIISHTSAKFTCNTGDRILTAVITDYSGIDSSLPPTIYYNKNAGPWFNSPGIKTAGSYQNGTWTFTISASVLGGFYLGDNISYFLVAQDKNAPTSNVGSYPFGAILGGNVNNLSSPPPVTLNYVIGKLLSGTYPVGFGQDSFGGFKSLTDAAFAYNASCLSGKVVFELKDTLFTSTTESFPIVFGVNPYTDVNNNLTIKPAANTKVLFQANTSSFIKLNGADYLTIDGSNNGTNTRNLSFYNNSTAANASIWIASLGASGNGATNNTIKNCNIKGVASVSGTTAIYGIRSSSTTNQAASAEDNDYLTIQNNNISGTYIAVSVLSSQGSLTSDNLVITGNDIGAQLGTYSQTTGPVAGTSFRGIEISNSNNSVILKNNIDGIWTNGNFNNAGIEVAANANNLIIDANKIHGIYSVSVSGYGAYGINVSAQNSSLLVKNNFIYDIMTVNYSVNSNIYNAFGIRFAANCLSPSIYNNTISLSGTISQKSVAAMSADVLFVTAQTNLNFKNNLLVNEMKSSVNGSKFYNVFCSVNPSFAAWDNNDYYGSSSSAFPYGNYYTAYLTSDRANLASWRSAMGGTYDVNSLEIQPMFVSPSDLHLGYGSTPSLFESNGQNLVEVTSDIDGESRPGPSGSINGGGTSNDIGADEFDGSRLPNCSTIIPGVTVSTANPVCTGVPFTLSLASGTNDPNAMFGLTFQWKQSLDGGATWNNIAGATKSTFTNPGISVPTMFHCVIGCTFNPGVYDSSANITVTLNSYINCYCQTSHYTNYNYTGYTVYGKILNVQLGSINYTNPVTQFAPPYFTSVPSSVNTNIIAGQTYTLSVKCDYGYFGAVAWIDWNANGVFEASEYYSIGSTSTGATNSSQTLSKQIVAPLTIPTAAAKIRIRTNYYSYIGYTGAGDACTKGTSTSANPFYYGETMDFQLNLKKDCPGMPTALFNKDSISLVSANYILTTNPCTSPLRSYTWNTGDTSSSIAINKSGTYVCSLNTGNGCSISDTIHVNYLPIQIANNDTSLCGSVNLQLSLVRGAAVQSSSVSVGDLAYGGIVAYILQPNDIGYVPGKIKGIVVANNDLPLQYTWGTFDSTLFANLSSQIGKGQSNTALIMSIANTRNINFPAAIACDQYVSGGYSDWFLPSENELTTIRTNLATNGNANFHSQLDTTMNPYWAQFKTGYWSSSMMTNGAGALAPFFSNSGVCGCAYFESYWVRPARYFDASNKIACLWSTGDTSSSIVVSPTHTTKYYCNFTDGVSSGMDSVLVQVHQLPANLFNQDTINVCGSSMYLAANVSGVADTRFSWNTGDTTSSIMARQSGWYSCIVHAGICQVKDSVYVNLLNVQLSNDTTINIGSTVQLSALSANGIIPLPQSLETYSWSNGATTPTISVNPSQTTTYYCTVKNGTNSCTDSVVVYVNPLPHNFISADSVISCAPSEVLDANIGSNFNATYQWNTGENTQSIVATQSGWYTCTISASGFSVVDSVYLALLNINLGNDTTICLGQSLSLVASTNQSYLNNLFNGARYLATSGNGPGGQTQRSFSFWLNTTDSSAMSVLQYGDYSTGTSSIDLMLNLDLWFGAGSGWCDQYKKGVSYLAVAHAATFAKTVYDGKWHHIMYVMGEGNNFAHENIAVYVDGLLVSRPNNPIKYCGHNWGGWTYNTLATPMKFGAAGGRSSAFKGSIKDIAIWNKALNQSEVLSVQKNGPRIISGQLVNYYPLNKIKNDSILVDEVGGNNAVIVGSRLGVTSKNISIKGNYKYLWSTGDTTLSINVHPTQTTTYYCTISDGYHHCTDSIVVNVNIIPSSLFAQDTIRACGTNYQLNAASAGVVNPHYLWNTGDTSAAVLVQNKGLYYCTLDNGVCQVKDTVYVSVVNADILENDTLIVAGSPVALHISNASYAAGIICGTAQEGGVVQLNAPAGTVFTKVNFASYGMPNGSCGNFSLGWCHAPNSKAITESYVLGNNAVGVPANNGVFGDPCVGTFKRLYVEAEYSSMAKILWSNGDTTAAITVNPTKTTTYYCTINNGISSCIDSVTIHVKTPFQHVTSLTICSNDSIMWNDNKYFPPFTDTLILANYLGTDSLDILNLYSIPASVNVISSHMCKGPYFMPYRIGTQEFYSTGTHIVHFTNYLGCDSSVILNLVVDTLPLTIVDTTICDGSMYRSQGLMFTTSGQYLLSFVSQNMCDSFVQVNLTVLPNPIVSVNDDSICQGATAQLLAHGALNYFWEDSQNLGAQIAIGPQYAFTSYANANASFIVTGIDSNGCSSKAVANVLVSPSPIVNVNSANICSGSSANLTASGANTYAWIPSNTISSITGTSVIVNPTVNTIYTVTGTDQFGCSDTATANVLVYSAPTISVNSPSICIGSSAVLVASGASNYSWSPSTGLSATVGANITANPSVTTTYMVTGTDSNGCSSTKSAVVSVNALPNISVNAAYICPGATATLNASGANTYVWSPSTGLSATTGASVIASPSITTVYSLTGTNTTTGCSKTIMDSVKVFPLPIVSVNSASICTGATATLTATGASNYTWSPSASLSASTGPSVIASPNVTTTYTVTGINANGCSKSTAVVVTVNSNPTISVSPSSNSICIGTSTSIVASGASNYSWSPSTGLSATAGANVTANPSVTTTYVVTGTDLNGCVNTRNTVVTVVTLPNISVNAAYICPGATATLNASGANTYVWSPSTGLSATTGASVIASPSITTVYSLTGTNTTTGCSKTIMDSVKVLPLPIVSVNSASIVAGASATLTASGANSYTWSPSTGLNASTGVSVVASPSVTTNYLVSGTNSYGCASTSVSTVTVNAPIQSFSSVNIAPFNIPKFRSVVIDYNNDGLDDIIGWTYDANYSAKLYRNNGNSNFTDVTASTNCMKRNWISTIDLDGNGYTDVYGFNGDTLFYSLNNGQSFSSPSTSCGIVLLSSLFNIPASWISGPKFADYNSDGIYDLVAMTVAGTSNTVMAKLGKLNCSGSCTYSFQSSAPSSLISFSSAINPVYSFADLDNDGDFDMLLGNGTQSSPYSSGYYNYNYYIYENNAGVYSARSNTGFSVGRSSAFGTLGEFNNDGKTDIISGVADCCVGGAGSPGNPLYTFFSQGNINYLSSTSAMIRATDRKYYNQATIVDLNLDRLQDVVWTDIYTYAYGSSALQCYLNNGNNTFTEQSASLGINLGTSPTSVLHTSQRSTMLDVNGDMKPDLTIQSNGTYDGVFYNSYTMLNNSSYHAVKLKLVACKGLSEGWGATIKYKSGGVWTNAQHTSYSGTNYPFMYLGTKTSMSIDSLIVTWIGGGKTVLTNIPADTYKVVVENSSCNKASNLISISAINCVNTINVGQTVTATDSTAGGVWSVSNPQIASINSFGNITGLANGVDTIYYTLNSTCGVSRVKKVITVIGCVKSAAISSIGSLTKCAGDTVKLSATPVNINGQNTYSWYRNGVMIWSTKLSANFDAASSGSYKVVIANGVCYDTSSAVLVTINSKPVVSANSLSICLGTSGVLTASGATTYTWSPTTGLNTTSGNSVSANPSISTSYLVVGTNANGCSNSTTAVVTVNPLPNVMVNSTSLCAGSSAVLTASGAASYSWSPNNSLSATTGASVVVNPTLTSTYTVTGTDLNACFKSVNAIVNVKTLSARTINASICQGASYTVGTNTYTTTGTYVNHFTNTQGCDSAVTLNLIVKPNSAKTINASICQGANYTVGSNTYTTSGTYVNHFTNVQGCDSAVTLNLIVKPNSTKTINASICQGSSYSVGTNTYATSGTYVNHFTNTQGCDSAVTLNLIVKPNSTKTINASICQGANYTVASITYTTSGTYVNHFTNAQGCDSAVTLNLMVKPNSTKTINVSICQGASYTFGTNSYFTSGTYVNHFTNAQGCDSAVTLNLIVKPNSTKTINASICQGSSYTVGTSSYTASGTYVNHFTNAQGCDSAVTLNLIVKPASTKTINASICQGSNYTIGTNTYTTSGTYVNHFTNYRGCDSAVTLNLIVKPNSTKTINASICQGSSYTVGTSSYTTSGTYVNHFTNVQGCDSTVTLNLIVKPNSTKTINANICQGSSYSVGANTYATSGTYVNHFTNAQGCDSAVTLNLIVKPNSTKTINASICQGSSYTVGTSSYTASGTYVNHFANTQGCDSAVTLNLMVKPNSTKTINASICQGSSYTVGANTYTTSGSYVNHFTNAQGCDSAVTLNLIVKPTSSNTINASICQGANYTIGANNYTTSGTYVNHFTNTQGCDSTVTLNLIVKPNSTKTINVSICQGASYTVGTNSYSTSGTYLNHFTNAQGCDSAVTLNLIVKPTSAQTINASICQGTSYSVGAIAYTSSGTYVSHLTNYRGCDSAVTLNLIVKPSSAKTIIASICQGSSYSVGANTYTTSGTYVNHFTNAQGCDSSVTLNLIVKATSAQTINASICQGASYSVGAIAYTSSGTYVSHLTNYRGCDSAVTLNLIVKPSSAKTINVSICQGSSYSVGTNTYTSSGTYVSHLTNYRGCDSVITLNLIVKPTSSRTVNASICQGSIYTFGNNSYSSSGTYVIHTTNYRGCDSAVTLILNVKQSSSRTINTSICQGASYTIGTSSYTASGTYVNHFTNYRGCDSAVTLNLIVKPKSTKSINASICQGSSYIIGTSSYTASGTYVNHFTNYRGCDSAVTLNLIVKPTSTKTITVSICQGASYTIGTSSYTASGTYVNHFANYRGCDSAVTLNLIVKPASAKTINASICQGASYTIGTSSYIASGIYVNHFINYLGCDSAVTLNLIVKPSSAKTINASICQGSSYTIGTSSYTASGTYVNHFTNAQGCDSAVTLNLIVNPITTHTSYYQLCNGQSLLWNGTNYSQSTTDTVTLVNANGCDSIDILDLQINAPLLSSASLNLCQGSSNSWQGHTITQAGTYYDTISSVLTGCDSVLILNVQMLYPSSDTQRVWLCAGTNYAWNGHLLTQAGVYYDTTLNSHGCDSINVLEMNYYSSLTAQISGTSKICQGQSTTLVSSMLGSWQLNHQNFGSLSNSIQASQAGVYQLELLDSNGCQSWSDSFVLAHYPYTSITIQAQPSASICIGTSVSLTASGVSNIQWSNNYNNAQVITPTTSQWYYVNGIDSNACSSRDSIHLLVNSLPVVGSILGNPSIVPFTVYTYLVSNLNNTSYVWNITGGVIQSGQGTNSVTVMWNNLGPYNINVKATNSSGCSDSTNLAVLNSNCTLNYTIDQISNNPICQGDTVRLAVNYAGNATYQWYRNGAIMLNGTTDTLDVLNSGTYQVQLTTASCVSLSNATPIYFNPKPSIPQIMQLSAVQTGCGYSSITLATTQNYSMYQWSNGSSQASPIMNQSGVYSVTVSNPSGCSASSSTYNLSLSNIPAPNLCIVTVDSIRGKNKLVWEKPNKKGIDSFYVYKEQGSLNNFVRIAAIDANVMSEYIDNASNSKVHSDRYALKVKDTCGTLGLMGTVHQTIHLNINLGLGNSRNLMWNNYEGLAVGTYNVYRMKANGQVTLMASVPSSVTSYTDATPPAGTNSYFISIVNPNGNCSPTARSTDYSESMSNIVTMTDNVGMNELSELNIRYYPNPANKAMIVEMNYLPTNVKEWRMIDPLGRVVSRGAMNSDRFKVEVDELPEGVYYLYIGVKYVPVVVAH